MVYQSRQNPKVQLVKHTGNNNTIERLNKARIPEELIATGWFLKEKCNPSFIKDIESWFNITLEDKVFYQLKRLDNKEV